MDGTLDVVAMAVRRKALTLGELLRVLVGGQNGFDHGGGVDNDDAFHGGGGNGGGGKRGMDG